jgi:hypothetical protein
LDQEEGDHRKDQQQERQQQEPLDNVD